MQRKISRSKKPFYLREYCKKGNYTVWIVDGHYIRTNIDEEFTNFGHHYRFKFIPKNELWLDKENNPGEEHFFIDNMLVFLKNFERTKDYKESVRLADKKEKTERRKSIIAKVPLAKNKLNEKLSSSIRKEKLVIPNSKLNVWVVDGELVRDLFFLDFTEGGHDKVYNFIPPYEVWIDDDLSLEERKFVLLHEIHERNLMNNGDDYNKAHFSSSNIEMFCRHNKKELNKALEKELSLVA